MVKYEGRILKTMSNKEAEKEEMKDEAHDVEDEEQEEQEEVEVDDEQPSSVNSGKLCVLTSLLVIILAPDISSVPTLTDISLSMFMGFAAFFDYQLLLTFMQQRIENG